MTGPDAALATADPFVLLQMRPAPVAGARRASLMPVPGEWP